MLTDQQLTETAIRIVRGALDDILRNFDPDDVDAALCINHCGGGTDCDREQKDLAREIGAVRNEVDDAVNTLRVHLRDYAAARQINLNIGEALS